MYEYWSNCCYWEQKVNCLSLASLHNHKTLCFKCPSNCRGAAWAAVVSAAGFSIVLNQAWWQVSRTQFEQSVVGIIGRAATVELEIPCSGPCSPANQEQIMPLASWKFCGSDWDICNTKCWWPDSCLHLNQEQGWPCVMIEEVWGVMPYKKVRYFKLTLVIHWIKWMNKCIQSSFYSALPNCNNINCPSRREIKKVDKRVDECGKWKIKAFPLHHCIIIPQLAIVTMMGAVAVAIRINELS